MSANPSHNWSWMIIFDVPPLIAPGSQLFNKYLHHTINLGMLFIIPEL